MLIHYVVLIDNQALANFHIYNYHIFYILVKAKDHVQFDIKFYFEFLHNYYVDSL